MQEAWSEVTLGRILQKNNRQTFKNTSVTKHFIPLTFSYFGVIAISPQLQQQQHSNASEFRYTCFMVNLSWQTGRKIPIPGLTGAGPGRLLYRRHDTARVGGGDNPGWESNEF